MYPINVWVDSVDVSTRGKRRKAVNTIMAMLEKIRDAEERYMERIPLNLQESDAYDAADESVDVITNVILQLWDAY